MCPRIIFGSGQIARLPELVPPTSNVLLVYGGSEALAQRISELLPQPPTLIRQRGEPTVIAVDSAVTAGRAMPTAISSSAPAAAARSIQPRQSPA